MPRFAGHDKLSAYPFGFSRFAFTAASTSHPRPHLDRLANQPINQPTVLLPEYSSLALEMSSIAIRLACSVMVSDPLPKKSPSLQSSFSRTSTFDPLMTSNRSLTARRKEEKKENAGQRMQFPKSRFIGQSSASPRSSFSLPPFLSLSLLTYIHQSAARRSAAIPHWVPSSESCY